MSQEKTLPAQHQSHQPGQEDKMVPEPKYDDTEYCPAGKLKGKVALITGGDSGIGRAVAIAFAKEGADIVLTYLEEHEDVNKTKDIATYYGADVLTLAGDLTQKEFIGDLVKHAYERFGRIDVLVNNAAEQHVQEYVEDISSEQLEKTFQTNFFSMVYLTQRVIPYMGKDSAIINTSSVVAFRGNPKLLDYSATKGAITAFTRALASQLASRGIRVNSVAPGPIWTPLIPASFSADHVSTFGADTLMKRPGQPSEVAPAYVYLACKDSSYVLGQTIHVNGGIIVNS